jgi:hypothetical protein
MLATLHLSLAREMAYGCTIEARTGGHRESIGLMKDHMRAVGTGPLQNTTVDSKPQP